MRFEGRGEITRGYQGRFAFILFLFPSLKSLLGWRTHPIELVYIAAFVAVICELVWMWRRRIRERDGVLSADLDGLSVDGRLVIARNEMKAVYVTSSSESAVRIQRNWAHQVGLRLGRTEDARALVESLGFGLAHEPLRLGAMRGKARARTWLSAGIVLGVATAIAVGLGMWSSVLTASLGVVVLAFLVALVWASLTVVVGTDGLLLGPAFRSEFISYASLAGASAEKGTVMLSLRSGRRIRLAPTQVTAETFVAYVEEARGLAAQAQGATSAAAARLMPGDRTLGAWVADLRSLASNSTYREVPIEPDELRRVIDDPKAPPPARAGAAAALAGQGDGEARARAEAAARTSANPKLRVALSRIAAGADEIEMERALEPLLRESVAETQTPER